MAAGDGELAARFAYENLRSLAGMSSQIQAAVEQSTALFDKRAKRAELLLLKQCFMSWGSAQYDRKHKMERVVRRMGRLKLTQAWNVRTPPLARCASRPWFVRLRSQGTCGRAVYNSLDSCIRYARTSPPECGRSHWR